MTAQFQHEPAPPSGPVKPRPRSMWDIERGPAERQQEQTRVQRDRAMDDKWFAQYQHLDRARSDAYEAVTLCQPGQRLNEWATLSSRWRALVEFWTQVRDDSATTYLMRVAAEQARKHAAQRADVAARNAVNERDPAAEH
ncbi:hypothetical protein [Amycolatopsis suaedae]|uniref:Uncharacterized protein n=1 Tax=Amycolatopsis suaedae TaxID=2510978 RepID=A0A4Q7J1T3_9PSEU|nr:hypothetical protein [Amycolatopsis suaedae]RZQ60446.1 hypothetical protein EWH70_29565 [Amycolatopsis suaedae]